MKIILTLLLTLPSIGSACPECPSKEKVRLERIQETLKKLESIKVNPEISFTFIRCGRNPKMKCRRI